MHQHLADFAAKQLDQFPQFDVVSKLPKLPLPEIPSTIRKFLAAIEPLVSPDDFRRVKILADDLLKNPAICKISRALESKFEESENWSLKVWEENFYLKNRESLVGNSNPGLILPRQKFRDRQDFVRYLSKFIRGIFEFIGALVNGCLPVDRANTRERGQPLCMSQYGRLFRTFRKAGKTIDSSKIYSIYDGNQHIIISHRNNFYKVNSHRGGHVISSPRLASIICQILDEDSTGQPIGVLTSLNRDRWASIYERLNSDRENGESVKEIEKSLFLVAIDDSPEVETQEHAANLILQAYSGHCNRWFDKTLQIIATEGGIVGLNYEHSAAEGPVVVRMVGCVTKHGDHEDSEIEDYEWNRLRWSIDDGLEAAIGEAVEEAKKSGTNLDLVVYDYTKYGRDEIKKFRSSPDAFIQLALQQAYFWTHGKLVNTYESGSTRRFRLGRVENIRSATCTALEWAKYPENDMMKYKLFLAAMERQLQIMTEALQGSGIDCHLMAVEATCGECGVEGGLFADSSYRMFMGDFGLSTSQNWVEGGGFVCYGPVSGDGYGVSYNPRGDGVLFAVSGFKGRSDCGRLRDNIGGALDHMAELCRSYS